MCVSCPLYEDDTYVNARFLIYKFLYTYKHTRIFSEAFDDEFLVVLYP